MVEPMPSVFGQRVSGRLIGFVLAFALLAGLLPFEVTTASPNGVVISEFRFRGPSGGNDEFVELVNAGTNNVDISGWTLVGCNSAGTVSVRATVSSNVVLEPGDHYLFTNSGSNGYSGSVPGDSTYTTGTTDTGGIRLLDTASTVIDAAGSTATVASCREGVGLSIPTTNGENAFERQANGTQDTDNNTSDFVGPQTAGPQNRSATTIEPTTTLISEIQGSGSSSPIAGDTVTIEGIVIGWDDEVGANVSRTFPEDRGLFIQEELADEDGNPQTSEAIFVGYVSNVTDYPLGSVVQVTGQVREKFGLTMIAESFGAEPTTVGSAPLSEPIEIDPIAADAQDPVNRGYYESLENMRVELEVGVANSGGTNKFGELFLTPGIEQDRVFRTDVVSGLLAADADAGAGNPANPYEPDQESSTLVRADLFDTARNVVGPLAFSFDHYKIMVQPGLLPIVEETGVGYPFDEIQPAAANQIRIASFNVENYLPAGAELDLGTVSPEDEQLKRERIADAINDPLERPDVVAIQEVGTIELLQALAEELGGYTAYLEEGNDNRGIDVGFLIKDTVTASNARQLGKTAPNPTSVDCSDIDGLLFDRPPLAIDIMTEGGLEFTVISNHFSSKGAPDTCREAQAAFVRDQIAQMETAGREVIVTGDLNAFEDEGALTILQGPETTLTNQWSKEDPSERYSFQFSGRLLTLDHILITDGLEPLVVDFDYAHFDNDYYDRVFDAEGNPDGHKVSDHDPPVLTLRDIDTITPTLDVPDDVVVTATGPDGAVVIYPDPVVSDNNPGATASCTPSSGNVFPIGITTVTCVATDAAGNVSEPATFTVTVAYEWSGLLPPFGN